MDWQQILVFLIVAAAAAYLARGYFRRGAKGGCGGCPAGKPQAEDPGADLVQIELAPRRNKKPGMPR